MEVASFRRLLVLSILYSGRTHTAAAFVLPASFQAAPTLPTSLHVSTKGDLDPPRTIQKRKPATHGGQKGKPRSKVNKHVGSTNSRLRQSTDLIRKSPPLLADYATNCADNRPIQEKRLWDDAIDATCVHYDTCAGCTVGRNVANTNVVQAAQRYFADERYDGTSTSVVDDLASYPVVIPSRTTGWRTQAKLAVANKSTSAWKKDGCIFGLYQKGTHKLQAIPKCVVHHPSINTAVSLLEQATLTAGTSAYREDSREGDLRYVQLQVERATAQVCLTLVWNAATLKECQPSLARLVKALTKPSTRQKEITDSDISAETPLPPLWHSIWCHCNDGSNNNIFSRSPGRWHRLSGPEFLREPLPVAAPDDESQSTAAGWLYFSPLTFRQGNLDGFEILALDVARAVPPNSKVCELYGGVGVLGLTTLAHHYNRESPLAWLRCSDENPANARCFYRAVESLPDTMTGRGSSTERQRRSSTGRDKDTAVIPEEGFTLRELATMMESGKTFNDSTDDERRNSPKTVTYMVASAAKALRAGQALGAQVLIVDPPRRGLEDEVLDELCQPFNPNQPYVESLSLLTVPDEQVNWANDVRTLIYVSCGFDALASDCDRLLSSRGAKWTLKSTQGYILFPGSDHVETVAIFQRR